VNPVVLLPFRGGEAHRDRAYAFVRAKWEREGFRVFASPGPAGSFNKSAAVNAAAALAGRRPSDWNVAIISDADVVVSREGAEAACARALRRKVAVRPFAVFQRLSEDGSRWLMAGHATRRGDVLFSRAAPPGGIVVVPRDLWEAVGGMDERFRGWGGEDNALASSLRVMGGAIEAVRRGEAWHLWHPFAPHRHDDYLANAALSVRYSTARARSEMRALVAERIPGVEPLRGRHRGETATIIGKGPTLLTLTAADVPTGPVIVLNSAIREVRALGLPNPTYSMQKDCAVAEPVLPETLILSSAQSPDAWPAYPQRHVLNIEAEFELPWGSMSSPMAVELAAAMGCARIVMLCHDGYTLRIADKVENGRIVSVRPGGYYHAGVAATQRAKRHRLPIEWVGRLREEAA
jgi:hypothetical protein